MDRVKVHRILADYFNEGELRTLCFDLGIDFEDLPGGAKTDKARELVTYCERYGRLSELVDVGERLRPNISWRDEPESLSQIPLIAGNLPSRVELVGRAAEKAAIQAALYSRSHIISIEGGGGIGKTALALEVAHDCLEASLSHNIQEGAARFAGIIWTSAADRDLTLEALLDVIARTLDRPGILKEPLEQKQVSVRRLLQQKPYLVIVDNFETVTDTQVSAILADLPEPSKALITTRERYGADARVITVKSLPDMDSLKLMRTVGQNVGLNSIVSADDDTLLRLHQATGGLPLAIKWSIGQIRQQGQSLDVVLASLQGARGDIFGRMFARAWRFLLPDARKVLMVMPIFAAPVLRAAIETAVDIHDFALSEALGQLIMMSLVDTTDDLDSARKRYSIHPLTRFFASSELHEAPEAENGAHQRLAEFYQEFTEENGNFGNLEGYARLDADLPNIQNSIDWCWEHQFDQVGIRTCSNLTHYLINRGYWSDAIALSEVAARKATEGGDDLGAARLWVHPLAWVYRQRRYLDRADEYTRRALRVLEPLDEKRDIADAKRNLGRIAQWRGELEEADRLLTEALALFKEFGRDSLALVTTADLASVRIQQGNLDTAEALCKDALPEARRLNDADAISFLLRMLGRVWRLRGDLEQAETCVSEALSCPTGLNGFSNGKLEMAKIQLAWDDSYGATASLQDALEGFKKMGTRDKVKECEDLLTELGAPAAQNSYV